jgi:DNA-binding transcriptional regulator YdaS (Cro superfamily)
MDNRPVLIPSLQKAVEIVGGQVELAKCLGITQQRIWNWLYRNKCQRIPAEYVLPIERATQDRVTRYELRPDLYPLEEEDQAA